VIAVSYSQLTCLQGSLRMIININACTSNLEETHHALKFSALARQVRDNVIDKIAHNTLSN
jgi:hypothetical protein